MPDFIPVVSLGDGDGGVVTLDGDPVLGKKYKVTMRGGWTAGHEDVSFAIRYYHGNLPGIVAISGDEADVPNQTWLTGDGGNDYDIADPVDDDGYAGFTFENQGTTVPKITNLAGIKPLPDDQHPDYQVFYIFPPRAYPPIYLMIFAFDKKGYNNRATTAALYEDKSWGN